MALGNTSFKCCLELLWIRGSGIASPSTSQQMASNFFFTFCDMLVGSSAHIYLGPLGFFPCLSVPTRTSQLTGISFTSVCVSSPQLSGIFILHQGLGNEIFIFIVFYAFKAKYTLSISVLKCLGQKLLSVLNFMSAS